MKVQLELTEEEYILMINGLAELPAKTSLNLINKLDFMYREQKKPKIEEPKTEENEKKKIK